MNPSELQSELTMDSRIDVIEADMPDNYIYEGPATFLVSVYNQRQIQEVKDDYNSEHERVSVVDPDDTEEWIIEIHLSEE